MLRDRYDPMNLFDLVPQLSLEMEPVLAGLDRLLDDDLVFAAVRNDLAQRFPGTTVWGRPSTPVEVILRTLIVKRLYRWSYEETERHISDSLVLRQFCRLGLERCPDDTTLLRWARQIGPQTLEKVNDRVVDLARSLKVTRGRKLRVDSCVVETNIHHPTDSGLLGDAVRVISRLLRRSKSVLSASGEAVSAARRELFRTRTRTVRRLAQQMHRLARRKGEEAVEGLKESYRKLIEVTRKSLAQAKRVSELLRSEALSEAVAEPVATAATAAKARRLVERFEAVVPNIEAGLRQTVRRVIGGETVPSGEKVLSLFEPHTEVIVRHKSGKPVEFGRKLWLSEVEGGIVNAFRIVKGGGLDHEQLEASLADHERQFGRAPGLLAGDRGVYSAANERRAKERGVTRVVLPSAGRASPKRKEHEKQAWFRRGFRFRAGIEGRISVLRRRYELDRCRDHGEEGMGRWVGWGIVTANLTQIARAVATP